MFRTFFSFVSSSIGVADIHRLPWANFKSGGRRPAEKSIRDGKGFALFLSFFHFRNFSHRRPPWRRFFL